MVYKETKDSDGRVVDFTLTPKVVVEVLAPIPKPCNLSKGKP